MQLYRDVMRELSAVKDCVAVIPISIEQLLNTFTSVILRRAVVRYLLKTRLLLAQKLSISSSNVGVGNANRINQPEARTHVQ
jgi:hypothetical protein